LWSLKQAVGVYWFAATLFAKKQRIGFQKNLTTYVARAPCPLCRLGLRHRWQKKWWYLHLRIHLLAPLTDSHHHPLRERELQCGC
jgi:hypothetical protein